MITWIYNLLSPLEVAEAYVMVFFHKVATFVGVPADSGWAWAFSIVGLTVLVRVLLIPIFVRQIHASRKMQLIQPEMQKIQAKYKGKSDPESRQAMTQETMDLYKRTGTNPFSSCLPIILQSPFFFALFHLLYNIKDIADGKLSAMGPMTKAVAAQAEASSLFGAQLSSTFVTSTALNPKILAAALIVLMSVTTFTTQHQLMRKNMPAAALEGSFAKQQKMLLYVMPLIFAVSGINFPIGVLLYWLTTNLWTMGQQFYVIRRMPAPGSAAEKALHERQAKRGIEIKKLTLPGLDRKSDEPEPEPEPEAEAPKSGQRQQPKSKRRAKTTSPRPAQGKATGPNPQRPGGGATGSRETTSDPGAGTSD